MLFLRLSYTRSLAAALSETIALSRSPLCSLSLHLYSQSLLAVSTQTGETRHSRPHHIAQHSHPPLLSSLYTIRMLHHSTPLYYTIGYSAPLQSIGTHSLYSLSMAMYRGGGSGVAQRGLPTGRSRTRDRGRSRAPLEGRSRTPLWRPL